MGIIGPAGETGLQGEKGDKGSWGEAGPRGPKGDQVRVLTCCCLSCSLLIFLKFVPSCSMKYSCNCSYLIIMLVVYEFTIGSTVADLNDTNVIFKLPTLIFHPNVFSYCAFYVRFVDTLFYYLKKINTIFS